MFQRLAVSLWLCCIVAAADVQNIQPKQSAGPPRTKIIVSDGVYKCTALLASQLTPVVLDGQIVKGAILSVNDLVGNKKLGSAASATSAKK